MPHPNLELSTLEQGTLRVYVRQYFFFPLHKNASKEQVMDKLQKGLEKTKKAIPMLSAHMVPDTKSQQKGRYVLHHSEDFGQLLEKDLRGKYTLTYDQLKERNFPVSALPTDIFCPAPAIPPSGETYPVFEAQATLIDGGLVLNTNVTHLLADARTTYNILDTWAQNCRHVQDSMNTPACETLPESIFEKKPFFEGSGTAENDGVAQKHPNFDLLDEPAAPLKADTKNEVFYLSPEKLRALKKDASANLKNGNWISTNDAVTALIWRCVLAAQFDLATVPEGEKSLNVVCIDGRLRASPKLAEDHIGCPLMFATPAIDIKQTLASDDLSGIALKIRKAVEGLDSRYINSVVDWMNSIPDFDRAVPVSFPGLERNNILVSSWFRVPFYQLNMGPALGGRCESVRPVFEGVINGGHFIMPEVPKEKGGGMEIVVGLNEDRWRKFRQNKLWYKYAQSTGLYHPARKMNTAPVTTYKASNQRLLSQRVPLFAPIGNRLGQIFARASRILRLVR